MCLITPSHYMENFNSEVSGLWKLVKCHMYIKEGQSKPIPSFQTISSIILILKVRIARNFSETISWHFQSTKYQTDTEQKNTYKHTHLAELEHAFSHLLHNTPCILEWAAVSKQRNLRSSSPWQGFGKDSSLLKCWRKTAM